MPGKHQDMTINGLVRNQLNGLLSTKPILGFVLRERKFLIILQK